MWKWIGAAIVALVLTVVGLGLYLNDKIYIRFPHATVVAADFDRTYSPEDLRADFRYLTTTVEHIHPDVAAITDPAAYAAIKARTLAALDHPMTRAAFFRVIAPSVGRAYADGHTEIMTLEEEWRAYQDGGGVAPPFTITIAGADILIERPLGDPGPPAGSRLVSLNGVPADQLRTWLVETQSMETDAGREAEGAHRFDERVWSLGLRAPYTLVVRPVGATADRTIVSPGISVKAWKGQHGLGGDRPISVTIDKGVAHLVIKDFEQPWDKYQGWLKDAFQKIHDAHVRAVVLDLRQNTGGDTRQSDALQAYLSDRKLPAIKEVDVHATPEVKAAYRTLLPAGFRWIPLNQAIPELAGIQAAPDNGVFVVHPEGSAPTERRSKEPLAYGGKLYLLVSPLTYSTALIASAPYKYWHRATVIGEAPTEPLTFFGDFYAFDLPHTRLQMHVSHKRFVLFGSSGHGERLAPDIPVTAQQPDAYALALADIAAH